MVNGGLGLAERRSHIMAARDALRGLGEVLHEASGPELRELMTLADEVSAAAGAARAVITMEAISRGEVTESGMSAHAWVRDHAPSLRQGGAGHVARIAVEASGGARPPLSGDAVSLDPDSAAGIVWERVKDGCVSPTLAVSVVSEASRLAPLLRDEVMPTVTRQLMELGTTWGPTVMRRLRPRLLAEYGRVGVLDDLQHRLASAARLSSPLVESGDLTEYQLLMTPEQAVALEAAIGPLSAPAPNDETRERDLRPAAQRPSTSPSPGPTSSSGSGAGRCSAPRRPGRSSARRRSDGWPATPPSSRTLSFRGCGRHAEALILGPGVTQMDRFLVAPRRRQRPGGCRPRSSACPCYPRPSLRVEYGHSPWVASGSVARSRSLTRCPSSMKH
jgi:hypothetical protein